MYIHGVDWIIICLVMILVVIESLQRDSVSYVIDHYLGFKKTMYFGIVNVT